MGAVKMFGVLIVVNWIFNHSVPSHSDEAKIQDYSSGLFPVLQIPRPPIGG